MDKANQGAPAARSTLVIDRDKWLRGTGNGLLLAKDGTMCCLGFYGRALGVGVRALRGVGCPESTKSSRWPDWLVNSGDTLACSALMGANDKEGADEALREREIAKLFREHGVSVKFKGGGRRPARSAPNKSNRPSNSKEQP